MRLPLIAAAFYNVFLMKMNALLPETGCKNSLSELLSCSALETYKNTEMSIDNIR
jgi:hypothetical protein